MSYMVGGAASGERRAAAVPKPGQKPPRQAAAQTGGGGRPSPAHAQPRLLQSAGSLVRRRRRAAVLVGLALISGACGAVQPRPDGDPAPPVCAAGQIDGDVILLSRPDQLSPLVVDRFERRYGVDVVELTYEAEDDLFSRVTAGADDFDVVLLTDYAADILRRGKNLLPLDPIALPGRVNLDPKFAGGTNGGGVFYSVPMVWGTVGIGMNVNAVGADVLPTWGMVFDTYQTWIYAGRVSLLADGRQVLAAAMFYLGYSPNSTDRVQVRMAADLVAAAQTHLGGFDSEEYASRLVEGVFDVAHGKSDQFLEVLPAATADFRYAIPGEGAVAWVDRMAVPVTSRRPCSAHSFIDFILEPRNGAEAANYSKVATPNLAALQYVLPELAANPSVYPPPEVQDRLELLIYNEEIDRLYAEEFIPLEPA